MAQEPENVEDVEEVGTTFDPDAKRTSDRLAKELKKANIRSVFGEGAGRISLIVVGITFAAMLLYGGFKLFGDSKKVAPTADARGAIADAPGGGGDSYAASEREAQMRLQHNQQQAEAAKQSGEPFIAPPVLKTSEAQPQQAAPTDATKPSVGPKKTPEEQRREITAQNTGAVADPSMAAVEQRRQQQLIELKAYRDEVKKEVMPQVLVASGAGWKGEGVKPFSTGNYALPDRTKAQAAQQAQGFGAAPGAVSSSALTEKKQIFAFGDECYGEMSHCINTDNPGNDAIATIPRCKGFSDIRIGGKYEFKDRSEAVAITFDKLSVARRPAVTVRAVAMDDETGGTGLADDVDTHAIRRAVTTAISAVATGLGKAAQIPVGTTNTTTVGLTGQSTTVQEPPSTARQFKIAVGEAGQQFGEQWKRENDALRATVKVGCVRSDGNGGKEKGRPIKVVFMSDVYEEKK